MAPFREPCRTRLARGFALLLAGVLLAVALGVIADAGAARPALLAFLVGAYGLAWATSRRGVAPSPAATPARLSGLAPLPVTVAGSGPAVAPGVRPRGGFDAA